MSWYLFNDSPAAQLRGKKVQGYQNHQRTKIIMDWGLGELSPKKIQTTTNNIQRKFNQIQNKPNKIQSRSNNRQKKLQSNHQSQQLLYEKPQHNKQQKKRKQNKIAEMIKILTQSSQDQEKQQLIKQLKQYNKKHQGKQTQNHHIKHHHNQNNKFNNILSTFQYESKKFNSQNEQKHVIDHDMAKRLRFLENSLLPLHKQDNITAVLDYDLSNKLETRLTDSRISGKSHFSNKKNQSAVDLGDGFNAFKPIKVKVQSMNDKLKQMYRYDQWCKSRPVNHFQLG